MTTTKLSTPSGGNCLSHADLFTRAVCRLFPGPYAAKRMANAFKCSVRTCEQHIQRRRAISLDTAIEMAARDDRALAELMTRIEIARTRNAALHVALEQVAVPSVGVGRGSRTSPVGMGGTAGHESQGHGNALVAPGQADAGRGGNDGRAVVAGGAGAGECAGAAATVAPGWDGTDRRKARV